MKLAVYHNLPSGGAKRALYELISALPGDHTVDVFTLSTSDETFGSLAPIVHEHNTIEFHPLPLLGSPLGRLNQLVRVFDLFRLRRIGRALARRIDAEDYDAVFVHPCQFESCPSLLKHLRTPSIYFCQEPLRRVYESMPTRPYDGKSLLRRRTIDRIDPLPAIYTSILKRSDWAAMQSADCVLVNSKFIQGQVQDIYGIQAVVHYLGVDADLFSPGMEPATDFVISVGSLTPLKGYDFIIRSLARIPLDKRPSLLIICNFEVPNERSYLMGLSASAGVDVEILQGVDDIQLVESYRGANVTVYAPIREPFGLVAIESMACGTPVVAVAEGGVKETIRHGETGLLVERDEGMFAEAVQSIFEQSKLRQTMGEAGRRDVVSHWTWKGSAERLISVFLSVAQTKMVGESRQATGNAEDSVAVPDVPHEIESA